jgi:hypothetical protein
VKLTTQLSLVPRSKNGWTIPPLPQYAFMAWCSVTKKTQGYLYLYRLKHKHFIIFEIITERNLKEKSN